MGNSVRRFIAVVAILLPFQPASAKDASMPIMFVGDWCYDSIENKMTSYTLPSWTEGGICKKILSVNPWTFYSDGWHCEPIQVKQKKECAPSGCAYDALVIARCQPDGPVTNGTRKQFKFSRYKGNLTITEE